MNDILDGPTDVIWDVTYACPLRCQHCYSESGRRPARQLGRDDMLKVAEAIAALRPTAVEFAGGEPLLVRGLLDVAARISRAGVAVNLYTSGWTVTAGVADRAAEAFSRITVSVDGADATVHDRVRGRAGSFERAMRALAHLETIWRRRVAEGSAPLNYGVDFVVVRSNFHQIEEFCATVAHRFDGLGFVNFGAAVPSGLASRPGYAEDELLPDDRLDELTDPEFVGRLSALAPDTVQVRTSDNYVLLMHPGATAQGAGPRLMHVEPGGEVRAMPIYEGTVGSLLTDVPVDVWRRAVERWSDPFVVETLTPVRSMTDWAEAVRRIDRRFGTPEVLARIAARGVV
ncbi:radical SAM protein [Nonomuraea sp. NPDC050790]|uniref:radical SAM protein n=1 Tax=Nonomuraea sp. NPDC050790 TaxID=3364371 RepID=UPI0037916CFF